MIASYLRLLSITALIVPGISKAPGTLWKTIFLFIPGYFLHLSLKLSNNSETTTEITKKNYQLIKNEKEIEDWMKHSEEIGEFAIDTETTSLDPHTAKLVGISISNRIGNIKR